VLLPPVIVATKDWTLARGPKMQKSWQGRVRAGLDRGAASAYIFERTFDSGFAVPRSTPNSRRHSQGKLQLILRHAAQVFSEKGYDGASIRDISRATGISLSGLYYYFESKQQLLYLVQYNAFTSILRRLERRLAGVTDPVARLRIVVQNHLDYFLRHPVEMKLLSHEDEALEGEYRKQVAEVKRRYYEIIRGIFEELRRRGRVRRVNPRVAVLSLFGMMNWVYTWHNPRVDPAPARLADTMAGIFLEGVVNGHRVPRPRARRMHLAESSTAGEHAVAEKVLN
jgi:AcrR family transcriptional regulator